MPNKIKTLKPPWSKMTAAGKQPQRDDSNRPTASARGYCSNRHRKWRKAVLTAAAWQCQQCGRVCTDRGEAHADHISPVVHGTEFCEDGLSRYDVAAGQCLCAPCHGRKTRAENTQTTTKPTATAAESFRGDGPKKSKKRKKKINP